MSDIKPKATAPPTGDMPAEEFRQYGHQMVDWIADFLENIDDTRVTPAVQPGFLRDALPD